MSGGLLFCVLACFFYAAEVVIADKWLGKTSPILITMLFGLGICIFSLPGVVRNFQNGTTQVPGGKEILIITAAAFLSFLADWFHFAALHQRVGAVIVATSYLLIPIMCSAMKCEIPSVRMIGAWILGGMALYLMSDELTKE